jgi:hypothetical protein
MEIVSIPVNYFAKESRQLFLAIAGVAGAIFFLFLPLSIGLLWQNKQTNKKIR